MGAVAEKLREKLTLGLAPETMSVLDESHLHAGHSGASAGGESHFAITLTSAAFAGLDRVARQRLVHRLLADELAGSVHALSLTTRAPGES